MRSCSRHRAKRGACLKPTRGGGRRPCAAASSGAPAAACRLRVHASTRAMQLTDLAHQVPEVNALVLKCLHHGLAAGLFPRTHQSFARFRQTCPALHRLGRDDLYWWSMWSGKTGCSCGHCEAAWLQDGWICPRLYYYL